VAKLLDFSFLDCIIEIHKIILLVSPMLSRLRPVMQPTPFSKEFVRFLNFLAEDNDNEWDK